MDLLESLTANPPPLQVDSSGIVRVGGTRIRLDSVIGAFNHGSSPEEILLKYPSLKLPDIYAVVTYYLWHRTEVDEYLRHRSAEEESVRKEIETRFPPDGVRERLLARRGNRS
ncbi:MAG: DUF433 domain-containing protein [Planctomycetaceae bacterium]